MKKYITFILLFALVITGCGKKESEELNAETLYENGVSAFYENVQITSNSMNSIDTTDPNYKMQMLSYLDDMNSHFAALKALSIPEKYSNNSSHITNAYSYMNQSVQLYHQALEMEVTDGEIISNAKSAYDTAMGCIKELGDVISLQQ